MNKMMGMVATSEAERASDGFVRGLALGKVTDNEDPKGIGRVRVRLELHNEDQESFWARVATPMAGNEMGVYFLPQKDDEVLVGFIGEDPSHPVVLGSVWNGNAPPPETNDGKNDRRLVRTRSGHEMRFDDGDTDEVEVIHNKGARVYLAENKAILETDSGNTVTIDGGEISVTAAQKITLSAPQVIVDASGKAEVKAGATCKIQGAMVEIN
ncbi:phage baseplate assembly protein V [Ruegeria meonggei]|uniref:phage baseplate assembly protein V n=1 Tax=Ruegeria meonggei TaxID=1446476 RepID=UPI00366BE606